MAELEIRRENVQLIFSMFFSELHKLCFLIFIATSEVYMATSYFVNKTGRKLADPIAHRSLRFKRNLCLMNMMSFAVAGYCFVRHNDRCEPYSEFETVFAYPAKLFFYTRCLTELVPFRFCSVHLVRVRRIFGRSHQHGISHDRRT